VDLLLSRHSSYFSTPQLQNYFLTGADGISLLLTSLSGRECLIELSKNTKKPCSRTMREISWMFIFKKFRKQLTPPHLSTQKVEVKIRARQNCVCCTINNFFLNNNRGLFKICHCGFVFGWDGQHVYNPELVVYLLTPLPTGPGKAFQRIRTRHWKKPTRNAQ